MFNFSKLSHLDSFFVINIFAIAVIGTLSVFSATFFPEKTFSADFFSQVFFYVAGFIIFFITSIFNYKKLNNKYIVFLVFILTIVLLVGVLAGGVTVGEAQRWIVLGPFTIQPSEFAKLTVVLICAYAFSAKNHSTLLNIFNIYKSTKKDYAKKIGDFIKSADFLRLALSALAIIIIIFLVYLQKSLGNTVIITLVFLSTLFFILPFSKKIPFYILVGLLAINLSFGIFNLGENISFLPEVKILEFDFLTTILTLLAVILITFFLNLTGKYLQEL